MNALVQQAFETDFAKSILSGDPDARPTILKGDAALRFRLFRNNYYHGLGQQLAEAYPAVRGLMGDEFFFAMARLYLQAHPPKTRSLALFGSEFPAFLEEFPPAAALKCLPDVARLERFWLEALHAADAEPLDPASLTGLGEALATTRFIAHPATRILVSDSPIVDIWLSHRNGGEPDAKTGCETRQQTALVTRPGMSVEVRPLSPAQTIFATALLEGENTNSAYEKVFQLEENFDVQTAFRRLLSTGAFTRVAEQTSTKPFCVTDE